MIGLTLLFLLVVGICVLFIVLHIRERNAIKALAVGQRFVSHRHNGDPWTDNENVDTIVDIKDGWVRTSYRSIFVTYKAKDFVNWYVKIS